VGDGMPSGMSGEEWRDHRRPGRSPAEKALGFRSQGGRHDAKACFKSLGSPECVIRQLHLLEVVRPKYYLFVTLSLQKP
jgi:hypothetical protein